MALPTVITVSGTYLKLDGTPEVGTIIFRTKLFVMDSDTASVMVPSSISDTLDGAGSFSVALPATNDPDWSPVGWTYEVTINLSQSVTKYHVQIPYDAPGGAILMSSLTPVAAVSGTLYAPYSHEHSGYVTDAELTAQVEDIIENSDVVEDAVDAAVAGALASYAPLNSPTFTGTVSGITKAMVGLGNVDNTADSGKPVSTAQQTALDLKANLASPTFTGTVAGITKSMVGLGNVDNTSDAGKPVSTAQQTALDLKANLASPTFTGTVSGISKSMVGLGNVDNTSDSAKPVSTAQQTALDLKANLASPTFTGTVSGITKSMVGLGNVDNTADSAKPVSSATAVELSANVRATDHALGGWTFDPVQVQGGLVLATAGLSYVVRLRVMISTVSNIHFHFTVGGSSLTSGQCFASLHNDAGAILGAGAVTADQSTNWASGGFKTCALTVGQGVTAGEWYKIRFWFNGTTGPTLSRGVNSSAAITNAGLSGTSLRFSTADSGLTTSAGAPGTIGTLTGGATAWWVAVS